MSDDAGNGPRVRRAPLPGGTIVVVRGEDLGLDAPRTQAERFRRRYPGWGRWGLSAYYAQNDSDIDDLASGQLVRFELLGIYRVSALRAAGYEVIPTFRTPHVTIAFTGELDEGLERLRLAVHEERPNPYHGHNEPGEVNP